MEGNACAIYMYLTRTLEVFIGLHGKVCSGRRCEKLMKEEDMSECGDCELWVRKLGPLRRRSWQQIRG